MKSTRRLHSFFWLLIAVFASSLWAAQQGAAPQTGVSPSVRLESSVADLDRFVQEFQFGELATRISKLTPSAERDYFAGVLANREGRVEESIALLEKALPAAKASNPRRSAVALRALADDYVKSFRYAGAIRAFDDLLRNFAVQLDKAERQSTSDDYRTVLLLKDAPSQTISFSGPVDLPVRRNQALGTLDAVLTIGDVTEPWVLDTGANFSVVSASFARRLGIKPLPGKAQTQGITGAENKLQVAILPEVRLGGAVVHNVVLLVLEDDNLNVPSGEHTRYQINAIVGYPVFHALQRITFTSDGHFLAGPDSPAINGGARVFMSQLTPLLEANVADRSVLFSFDTGANHTIFSDRYRRQFPSQFSGLHKRPYILAGAGGTRRTDVYYLRRPQLAIGATTVTLNNVPVLPPLGTDTDKLFGNLGRDVTDPYGSFTIDFAHMRFQLREKLPPSPAPSQ